MPRRRALVVAGVVAALIGGLVLVLDEGNGPESVRSVAPTATAETTTPPSVLGDSVERVPDGQRRPDVVDPPTGDVPDDGTDASHEPGPPTSVAEPAPAPPPAGTAPPAPPTTAAPEPEPTAETASIEVRRGPDAPVMHVELQRDGETVAAGTLEDTLRFDELVPGPYRLQVSWDYEHVEDEETGETIAGGGMARYDIDAAAGTTVVVCDPDACTVTERP